MIASIYLIEIIASRIGFKLFLEVTKFRKKWVIIWAKFQTFYEILISRPTMKIFFRESSHCYITTVLKILHCEKKSIMCVFSLGIRLECGEGCLKRFLLYLNKSASKLGLFGNV